MCNCRGEGRYDRCCGKRWGSREPEPEPEPKLSLFERFQEWGSDPDHYTYAEWCRLYEFIKKG